MAESGISVGELVAVLALRDLMSPALKAAEEKLGGFSASTKALAIGAGAVAVAGALAAVGTAVGFALKNLLDTADAMSNLEGRTGISTAALQQFEFAGAAVGISAETVATSMNRFQRSLSEGSDKTTDALDRLGLSASALKGMLPEEQLATVVETISKIPDAALRTATAMELMGRGGAAMIPLGAGLAEAMQRAKDLGYVMEANTMKAADALGDRLGELHLTIGGMVRNFVGVIATSKPVHDAIEALTQVFGSLSRWARDNQETLRDWVATGLGAIVSGAVLAIDALGFLSGAFAVLRIKLNDVEAGAMRFGLAFSFMNYAVRHPLEAAAGYERLKTTLGLVTKVQEAVNAGVVAGETERQLAIDGLRTRFVDLADAVEKAAKETVKFGESAAGAGGGIVELSDDVLKMIASLQGIPDPKAMRDLGAALASMGDVGKIAPENLEGLVKQFQALDRLGMQLPPGADAIVAAYLKFKDAEDVFQATNKELERQDKILHMLGPTVGDVNTKFLDLMEAVQLSGGSFDDLGKLSDSALQHLDEEMQGVIEQAIALGALTDSMVEAFVKVENAAAKRAPVDPKLKETEHQLALIDARQDEWNKGLQAAANLMTVLGISADSTLGKIIGGLSATNAATGQFTKGLAGAFDSIDAQGGGHGFDLSNLSVQNVTDLAQGIAGLIGAFQQATDSANVMARAIGGAMVGMRAGGEIGKMIPVIGESVGRIGGAIIGAIGGILRTPGWVRAGREAGRVLGFAVSDELAKAIEETSKSLKVSRGTAALLSMDKAVEESGKSWREMGSQIGELFDVAGGKNAKAATAAIEQIDKAWAGVRKEAEKAGIVGDKVTRDMIAQAKAAGQLTEEMRAFLKVRGEMAAQGAAFLGGLVPQTIEQANALAKNFVLAFDTAIGELGFVAGADAMRESFDKLRDQMQQQFGEEFVQQAFGPLQRIFDMTAEDSPFRGAAQAVDGLVQIFTAAADTGRVTTDSFANMGISARNAFEQAIAGGATQAESLQVIQPLLQALMSASQQYGITLDANTQSLIDQAQASGLAFKTDPMERAATAMEKVAIALDKTFKLGMGLEEQFNRVATAAGGVAGAVGGIGAIGTLAFPEESGRPSFGAARGFGPRVLTEDTIFQAHRGEKVLIMPQGMARKSARRGYYDEGPESGPIEPMGPGPGAPEAPPSAAEAIAAATDAMTAAVSEAVAAVAQPIQFAPTIQINNDPFATRERREDADRAAVDAAVNALEQRVPAFIQALERAGFKRGA